MRFSLFFALAIVAAPALASVGTQSSEQGMIKKRLVGGVSKFTGSGGNPTGTNSIIGVNALNNLETNIASVVNEKRDEEVEKRSRDTLINALVGNNAKVNALSYVKPHKRSAPEPEKRSYGQGEIINGKLLEDAHINVLSLAKKSHKRSIVDVKALNKAKANVASVVDK